MRHYTTSVILLGAAVALSGCASRRAPSLADRFMVHREAKEEGDRHEPPPPSLEEAIGKVRKLMAEARPSPRAAATTLEDRDAVLIAARARLQASPTLDAFIEVADVYRRRGLIDQAYDQYMRALRLNSHSAEAYDGLARVWRDWGLPHLGLGDAYRAVYYAPDSAAPRNTLGTLLQATGDRASARRAYEAALSRDAGAAYALNNLCYLSFLEGRSSQAIDECQGALRVDPTLSAAKNNLALTYAAIGRLDLARQEFVEAGGKAGGAYNMGVVHLARKDYTEAVGEFDAAHEAQPAFADAQRMAWQARQQASHAPKHEDSWP
jgi:tetratricopeptide (TPR) repeat protein